MARLAWMVARLMLWLAPKRITGAAEIHLASLVILVSIVALALLTGCLVSYFIFR